MRSFNIVLMINNIRGTYMKFLVTLIIVAVIAVVVFLLGSDFNIKDKGALPDVNVSVEEGRMPEVEVDTPNVDVKMDDATVSVPSVEMKEKDMGVPSVDVDAAEDSMIDEANKPDTAERQ